MSCQAHMNLDITFVYYLHTDLMLILHFNYHAGHSSQVFPLQGNVLSVYIPPPDQYSSVGHISYGVPPCRKSIPIFFYLVPLPSE